MNTRRGKTRQRERSRSPGRQLRVAVASTALVLGTAEVLAASSFEGRIEARVNYTDNLYLTRSGQPNDDAFILELMPAITWEYESPRLAADLDYELRSFAYPGEDGLDQSYHTGAFGSTWQAIPEWFRISTNAGYTQRVISPERVLNFNDLFATDNLTDQATASVTPLLSHAFGKVTAEAAYTAGRMQYAGEFDPTSDLDDSTRHGVRVDLFPTRDEEGRVSWMLGYRGERIDYENSPRYDYEQAIAGIGIPLGGRIELLAEGGSETDLSESLSDGGFDAGFWRAGFRLIGSSRTQAEAKAGRRFFGDTYSARLSHTARRLTLEVSYLEEPQTETERLTRFTGPLIETELPPSGGHTVRPTSEPYVLKEFDASVRLKGRLTTITLGAFRFDQNYIRVRRGEENRGVRLEVERRLGSRTTGTLALSRTDTYFAETPDDADENDYAALLFERQASQTITLNARVLYVHRSGPAAGDYHATVLTLGFVKTF